MTTALEKPAPGHQIELSATVAAAGAAAVALTIAAVWATAWSLISASSTSGAWAKVFLGVAIVAALAVLLLLRPAIAAFNELRQAHGALQMADFVKARAFRARSRTSAAVALGGSVAVLCLTALMVFLLANNHAVQDTFLQPRMLQRSWLDTTKAFGTNLFIAVIAELLVLGWGLVLAIARSAPGRAGRPIAMLARVYIDAFRAVPAIIVIYLVGFGLPLAGVPLLSSLSPTWAAILALVLTYGAYVAEVYRAGIESIHWSQTAAARSLGLSYTSTMRFVIVPQAVRRVIPPLLNDFIGLQKDTALVTVIGTVDAFTQAKTYSSNYFNLSSVTIVAGLFVLITIPQTFFVDRLIERGRRGQR
ncbi:amino acid ABC transporter permease [Calidifontibacter terrae]